MKVNNPNKKAKDNIMFKNIQKDIDNYVIKRNKSISEQERKDIIRQVIEKTKSF